MVSNKTILGILLVLVVLTSSVYYFMPDKFKISIENTRTQYFVWENTTLKPDGTWVLSASEYVNLYDGTTKMKANSRTLKNWTDETYAYESRTSIWKNNITTVQTYVFKRNETDIELVPFTNTLECFNCAGKIIQYEIKDIAYSGQTKDINSPFAFGHNMMIVWQNTSYYSKVFQQSTSDKIIIKYKAKTDYETFNVRLYDPVYQVNDSYSSTWTNPNLASDQNWFTAATTSTTNAYLSFNQTITHPNNINNMNLTFKYYYTTPSGTQYFSVACKNYTNLYNNMILYFPFDTNEGATTSDYSPQNKDGTITGATFTLGNLTETTTFNHYTFDGKDDYVSIRNFNNINGTTAASFMAWVKMTDQELKGDGDIFTKGVHSTNVPLLIFRDEVVGGSHAFTGYKDTFSGFVYDGTDTAWVASARGSANDTNWHHLAITFAANSTVGLKIYVDGRLSSTTNTTKISHMASSSSIFRIGADVIGAGQPFNGSIDEPIVLNKTLTATEISYYYNETYSRTTPYTDWYVPNGYRSLHSHNCNDDTYNSSNLVVSIPRECLSTDQFNYRVLSCAANDQRFYETNLTYTTPTRPYLTLESLNKSITAELGSNINVTGNFTGGIICLDINYTGYGNNYICSEDSISLSINPDYITTRYFVSNTDENASQVSIKPEYLYVNYTKPGGADRELSFWQVKHGTIAAYNITLPLDCWNQQPLQNRIYGRFSALDNFYNSSPMCYNGSTWKFVGTSIQVSGPLAGSASTDNGAHMIDNDYSTGSCYIASSALWRTGCAGDFLHATIYEESMIWNVGIPNGDKYYNKNVISDEYLYFYLDNRTNITSIVFNISSTDAENLEFSYGEYDTVTEKYTHKEDFIGKLRGSKLFSPYMLRNNVWSTVFNISFKTATSEMMYLNKSSFQKYLNITFKLHGFDMNDGNYYLFTDYFENSSYTNITSTIGDYPLWLWDDFSTSGKTSLYTTGTGSYTAELNTTNTLLYGTCYSTTTCSGGDVQYEDDDNVKFSTIALNISKYKKIEFYASCDTSAYGAVPAGCGYSSFSPDGSGYGTCGIYLTDSPTVATYTNIMSTSSSAAVSSDGSTKSDVDTESGTYTLIRNEDSATYYTYDVYKNGVFVKTTSQLSGDINLAYVGSTNSECDNGGRCTTCVNCPRGSATQKAKITHLNVSGIAHDYTGKNNYSKTGTFISSRLYSASHNIDAATLYITEYKPTGCNQSYYMSNNDGTTWETAVSGVKHVFVSSGTKLKYKSNSSCNLYSKTSAIIQAQIEVLPEAVTNVTIDVFNDGNIDWSYYGVLNSTTSPKTVVLTQATLNNMTAYTDIELSVASPGIVQVSSINVTMATNPVIIDTTPFQNESGSVGYFTFTGGTVDVSDLIISHQGGNETYQITLHTPDYMYSIIHNLTFFDSIWKYTFPSGIESMAYYPATLSSKNVDMFGQTATIPGITIEPFDLGGKPIDFYVNLNETYDCVNMTFTTDYYTPFTCYQETANKTSTCGGLATGTYGETVAVGKFFNINYTKPYGTDSLLWQVRTGNTTPIDYFTENISINSSNCFSSYTDKVVLRVAILIYGSGRQNYKECHNGSSWILIGTNTSACGNQSGVPTSNKASLFDADYTTGIGVDGVNWRPAGTGKLFEEGVFWSVGANVPRVINSTLTNTSWFQIGVSLPNSNDMGIWSYINLKCSYSSWSTWQPELSFGACCEDCDVCEDIN